MAVTKAAKGNVVGCQLAQIWKVGSDGFAYGTAGEGAANATTTHALPLAHALTATLPSPARVVANLRGGDRWRGSVMFGISDLGQITMTSGDLNSDAVAMVGRSVVDETTNSRWKRFSDNVNLPVPPQFGMMFTAIYQSRDDDSDGENLYIHYIVPRCQVQPQIPGMNFQAENEMTYLITPTMASREPSGRLLSAGAMALHENKTPWYAIVAPKPLSLTTFISDGTAVTFNTLYRPTSTVVTLNNTPNEFARNGTLQALTSITLLGVATMAAAGTAGDKNVLLYETDLVAA